MYDISGIGKSNKSSILDNFMLISIGFAQCWNINRKSYKMTIVVLDYQTNCLLKICNTFLSSTFPITLYKWTSLICIKCINFMIICPMKLKDLIQATLCQHNCRVYTQTKLWISLWYTWTEISRYQMIWGSNVILYHKDIVWELFCYIFSKLKQFFLSSSIICGISMFLQ